MAKTAKTVEKEEVQTAERHRRILWGIVVSAKMQKTIVVKVDRRVRHPRYGKIVTISKRYKVHDEKNEAKMGDRVDIVEMKPMSRHKRFALQRITLRSTLQG